MKYKLLVAEDEAQERNALCSALTRHLGEYLTIIEAGTGAEALRLFHLESPQLAFLNIELPDMSGLDVARHIRESRKPCVFLFISDLDNFSYAKQAISLRALEYIMKPWDEKKLISSVEEAIHYCSHIRGLSRPAPHPPRLPNHPEIPKGTRLALVQEEIRAYIDAHYMEELSMKTVAHAMNYSDAYFCKLFKQCFHVNFSTYLNQYRIQKSQILMERSRASVKDIAMACGYTDSNYFARVFKRITDLTPSEYRLSLSQKSANN